MATTSFLYHTLGLEGYRHLRTDYRNGKLIHHIERAPGKRTCAECGASARHVLDGQFERSFLAVPVGFKRQEVILHGHLQICKKCEARVREPIPFAEGKNRYLKTLGRYNMTTAMDLETGEILYAQEGKDSAALIPFLQRLKQAKVPLKAIAVDMSEAYAKAIREVFGNTVDIVHDKFHVVALASNAVDETRKDLARQLEGEDRNTIKGSRFLLLKGKEKLDEKATERLMNLMVANEPLYLAYLLKEDLRTFWSLPDEESGKQFLDLWSHVAKVSGNKHFIKLAETLNSHSAGLLAYFRHRISTGPLEGINNKIKVLKRQAYGFRDMDFFKLRLYFLRELSIQMPG